MPRAKRVATSTISTTRTANSARPTIDPPVVVVSSPISSLRPASSQVQTRLSSDLAAGLNSGRESTSWTARWTCCGARVGAGRSSRSTGAPASARRSRSNGSARRTVAGSAGALGPIGELAGDHLEVEALVADAGVEVDEGCHDRHEGGGEQRRHDRADRQQDEAPPQADQLPPDRERGAQGGGQEPGHEAAYDRGAEHRPEAAPHQRGRATHAFDRPEPLDHHRRGGADQERHRGQRGQHEQQQTDTLDDVHEDGRPEQCPEAPPGGLDGFPRREPVAQVACAHHLGDRPADERRHQQADQRSDHGPDELRGRRAPVEPLFGHGGVPQDVENALTAEEVTGQERADELERHEEHRRDQHDRGEVRLEQPEGAVEHVAERHGVQRQRPGAGAPPLGQHHRRLVAGSAPAGGAPARRPRSWSRRGIPAWRRARGDPAPAVAFGAFVAAGAGLGRASVTAMWRIRLRGFTIWLKGRWCADHRRHLRSRLRIPHPEGRRRPARLPLRRQDLLSCPSSRALSWWRADRSMTSEGSVDKGLPLCGASCHPWPIAGGRRRRGLRGRVLVVDDDPSLGEMLGIVLRQEGFEPVFVRSGDQAIAAFHQAKPDLVLLDLMLPGKDGLEICRELRMESGVPIVMLTAKTDTVDIVLGLESGADDYITKPFSAKELVARIRARLRRRDTDGAETLRFHDIEMDVMAHQVTKGGKSINLTPLEFELLSTLARRPRQVFTREVLLEQVWGYRYAGDTRLVNVHVQRLRAKIEDDPENPRVVQTVRGVGYRIGPEAASEDPGIAPEVGT